MLQRPRSRDVLPPELITVVPAKKTFNVSPLPPKASLMRRHSINIISTFNALTHVSVYGDMLLLRDYPTNRQLSRQLLVNPLSYLSISSRGATDVGKIITYLQ